MRTMALRSICYIRNFVICYMACIIQQSTKIYDKSTKNIFCTRNFVICYKVYIIQHSKKIYVLLIEWNKMHQAVFYIQAVS